MGPPGQDGNEDMHVAFVGYTPATYMGNLGGRAGAHALCNAAYPGSHFCTNWEVDQANPPPTTVSIGAWVDIGNASMTSRFFREQYSTTDIYTCAGWTDASASQKIDGFNPAEGEVFTQLGGFANSYVGSADGGCENPRPLACCQGGTTVRFRGFTAATPGNLGGRTGARAMCDAAFSGSHMCTDWEADQAAIRSPIPATGAWIDIGNSDPSTRLYREPYSTTDIYTCAGWTDSSASQKIDGFNPAEGELLTQFGGVANSYVGSGDGGCENARPVACCDGSPPQ